MYCVNMKDLSVLIFHVFGIMHWIVLCLRFEGTPVSCLFYLNLNLLSIFFLTVYAFLLKASSLDIVVLNYIHNTMLKYKLHYAPHAYDLVELHSFHHSRYAETTFQLACVKMEFNTLSGKNFNQGNSTEALF